MATSEKLQQEIDAKYAATDGRRRYNQLTNQLGDNEPLPPSTPYQPIQVRDSGVRMPSINPVRSTYVPDYLNPVNGGTIYNSDGTTARVSRNPITGTIDISGY